MSGPLVKKWCDTHGDYKTEQNGNPMCPLCYLKLMLRYPSTKEEFEDICKHYSMDEAKFEGIAPKEVKECMTC